MNYTKNTQDAINFIRSELQNESNKKMDKTINKDKVVLLNKILKIIL